MNINESGCRPCGLASALMVIGVSACYSDIINDGYDVNSILLSLNMDNSDCSCSKERE